MLLNHEIFCDELEQMIDKFPVYENKLFKETNT